MEPQMNRNQLINMLSEAIALGSMLGTKLAAIKEGARTLGLEIPDATPQPSTTRIVDVGSLSGGGTGPYTGTGRDTTITPLAAGAVVDLPHMTSKNFEVPAGATVAFKIVIPPGRFADMGFRAGIGEYASPRASWDLALSRKALEIEGAPARDQVNIAGVTFSDDAGQVFSPGEWYLNVRVNKAEGLTSSFTISWYGPHDPK